MLHGGIALVPPTSEDMRMVYLYLGRKVMHTMRSEGAVRSATMQSEWTVRSRKAEVAVGLTR